jgi:phosphoglycolate phosphatase-like HAD superfamily hydrolase|tara:strand:- start:4480 stop:5619 length:1140 start_codon:yes stop_codon:yes gene_type:complete
VKPRYVESQTTTGETYYIRQDRLRDLTKVDVVVFDCDGVLLDVRESYSRAVARTTSALVETMTGYAVPEELYDSRLNRVYKRTGGFNNDWALTYAFIIRTLAELPEGSLKRLRRVAVEALKSGTLFGMFKHLRENPIASEIPVKTLYRGLTIFAEELDSTGWEAVDRLLCNQVYPEIRDTLGYPGGVGEGLVATVFEEIFSGAELFERSFGIEGIYGAEGSGFIENEGVIINDETLRRLTEILGGARMGISSGSLAATAMHVLGESINEIKEDARIWYEAVDEAQAIKGMVGLHKPHPFSLLKASKPFKPYDRVLYVGDTMADRLMVRNAGEPPFLFAGVHGNVHGSEEARDDFMSCGSDIVALSVNDLPEILENVRDN